MNVLVCVKRVPAPGASIVLTDDGLAIDTSHLAFTVSPHEECAVEEAVRLVADHGGSATVLTLGTAAAEEQLRAAIATGIDHGVLLETGDEHEDWDPFATANAIVDAVHVLEREAGTFDLVLVGNESADAANHQVGIRVAHALGRGVVAGVKHLELTGDRAVVQRPMDDGIEVYELDLPAVVAVREGLNLPRYPSMRGRLTAAKAPIRRLQAARTGVSLRTIGLRHAAQPNPETVILGHGAEAVPEVVRVFEEVGLL